MQMQGWSDSLHPWGNSPHPLGQIAPPLTGGVSGPGSQKPVLIDVEGVGQKGNF
jgi:hypothetical protein